MTGQNIPQYITSFEEAGLRPLLLQNIKNSGYVKPTPVQKGSIAVILAKRDLIASAVTGSGKTVIIIRYSNSQPFCFQFKELGRMGR